MKTRNLPKALAWYWRTFPRLFFLLVLFIILFAIIWSQNKKECNCFKMGKPGLTTFQATAGEEEMAGLAAAVCEIPQNQNFTVKGNVIDPLPIPYEYLLGSHPTRKRYLSIGISSIHRKNKYYLMRTIESIFSQSSPEELKEIVLVVYLANNDSTLNKQTAKEIKDGFSSHIDEGNLLVICSSLASYPSLQGLQRNFWDKDQSVQHRSKQNVDYAFLVNFCASLSHYYLMLEDDVVCANGFLSIIQQFIRERMEPWTTVAFSTLGYIGKLYHNEDLPKLARFLLLFYDVMPCDWLLELFHQSKAQKEIITFRPSLFQHIGRISSFHTMETIFKDPEFQEDFGDFGDFPAVSCYTDISVFDDYVPEEVCPPGKGVFWGRNVTSGSSFTIVFETPIILQKLQIYTGSAEYKRDILYSGYVELGTVKIKENDSATCRIFRRAGDFRNGTFELDNFGQVMEEQIHCLRIQVTVTQKEWLIIRKINIWVKKD
ncbi:alpha-1,3-mannosyl-glycoprotein 4-beta-N-acetylglucosaminyltransferase C-like [Malaclemys terrapin pileata]|uniref:alpha-1,3-mannosyl-glycoprotein 4-beta-N-acetylglucosaminyltransferase C-like n=1 Tax=Malaclemys terrapin pileata TaxID=2991368 RepID=UPI0023A7966B|nr:alpha-1,3-mannosyl-glycoprotein 4-beta-N-acetylglucosaminyltransferase C-like [Malaclemys terrapin pileata]XP_053884136.1 alpha-1,3-mannosyl-glycoprotein 4-beta-N-acetylglucosaminyltransferase C-like [Malaclemys terrapin pileata]